MILSFINLKFVAVLSFGRLLTAQSVNCTSLHNQPSIARPVLIDLNLDELCFYPFMVRVDRCGGSFNTHDDLSGRIFVPNKTKDVNVKVFNTIAGINESKSVVKHVSCNCKCGFNGKNSNPK